MEARSRRGSLDHLGIDGQLVEPTDPAHAGGGPLRLFHNRSYAGCPGEEACRTAGARGGHGAMTVRDDGEISEATNG